jgi:hypothetical protein
MRRRSINRRSSKEFEREPKEIAGRAKEIASRAKEIAGRAKEFAGRAKEIQIKNWNLIISSCKHPFVFHFEL